MKKNDLIELTITDMGVGGEGIGKDGAFPFFVKGAVIGDRIIAGVTKVKKTYAYARLVRILSPSPVRVSPACSAAGPCGGCSLQALSYEEQVRWKVRKVSSDLIRIGGFSAETVEAVMEAPLFSEKPYRYRNKMEIPVGRDRNGHLTAGFYASHSHRIVPAADCMLGACVNRQIIEIVLAHMMRCDIEPYDETTGHGLVRHIMTRIGEGTGEIMVCLVLNGRHLPGAQELADALFGIRGVVSFLINVNENRTNVILGEETIVVRGKDQVTDVLCGLSFRISPRSFYQVNHDQAQRLYEKVLEYADLHGAQTVWDLYCGIGTISLCLAREAGQVYGVEIVPEAVRDAEENAALNGITNVHFFCGKAEEVFAREMAQASGAETDGDGTAGSGTAAGGQGISVRPDVAVVDPPRKGCDGALLQTLLDMRPDRIVYVSCDSATLSRDLKILCAQDYRIERACVCDQFSQTVHTESVVKLARKVID